LPNLQDGIFEGLFQSTGPVTPANSAGKKVTPAIINDNNQAGLTPSRGNLRSYIQTNSIELTK